MTRAETKNAGAAVTYDVVRRRIVDLAIMLAPGVLQFVGDGETPGVVYRQDDDITVVWSGGMTCVVAPDGGRALTLRIADRDESLSDLTARMSEEADLIMQNAIDAYRIVLHQLDLRGY